jgi:hypothetical protein
LEKVVGSGFDGACEDGLAGAIEDAERQGPGVQIDAAVESVLLIVESHHGLQVRGLKLATSSVPDVKRP